MFVGEGHGDVFGGSTLLVGGNVVGFNGDDDNGIASECCFRAEEDDAKE